MTGHDKLRRRIMSGAADADIGFDPLCALLKNLGFDFRVKGDHHIFTKKGVAEIINLQPKNGKAKPYQVKQVRSVILKYGLGTDDGD